MCEFSLPSFFYSYSVSFFFFCLFFLPIFFFLFFLASLARSSLICFRAYYVRPRAMTILRGGYPARDANLINATRALARSPVIRNGLAPSGLSNLIMMRKVSNRRVRLPQLAPNHSPFLHGARSPLTRLLVYICILIRSYSCGSTPLTRLLASFPS